MYSRRKKKGRSRFFPNLAQTKVRDSNSPSSDPTTTNDINLAVHIALRKGK